MYSESFRVISDSNCRATVSARGSPFSFIAIGISLSAGALSRDPEFGPLSCKRFSTMVLVDKNSLVIFHAVSGEMIKLNRTAAFPYSVTDKMTRAPSFQ